MDFDTSILFGNATSTMAQTSKRRLQSRNLQHRLAYLEKKFQYLQDHNWFSRLQQASVSCDAATLERLDKDWKRASLHGEKRCHRYHQTAFSRRVAGLRHCQHAINIRIKELTCNTRLTRSLREAMKKCPSEFQLPARLPDLYTLRGSNKRELNVMLKNDIQVRAEEQQEQLDARLAAGDKAGARVPRNIIIAEEMRVMWAQIRAIEKSNDAGL